MDYYALQYYLVDDYLSRRQAYREQHLLLAREANHRGELILAGAFSDPYDRALFIFRVDDISAVEEFVNNDPYVTNGLVIKWEIRRWMVVVGDQK
jgi:uncharacterized protein YciI